MAARAAVAKLPPVFSIRDGDLLGLINVDGHVIVPPEYEELRTGDPLILVRKSARVAYVDYEGHMVIAPQFSVAVPESTGGDAPGPFSPT